MKNEYIENITKILSLLLSIKFQKISQNILTDIFLNNYISLIKTNQNISYDNLKICANLIIILEKLIENYTDYDIFWEKIKETENVEIVLQVYLQKGELVNLGLHMFNLLLNYQSIMNKIIIKCINYKLIDLICQILINNECNENTFLVCLKLLLNLYIFLMNNIKNSCKNNISKYFNCDGYFISKVEQLILHSNKDISFLANELYQKLMNKNN